MAQKIKLMLDYGCFPLWWYESDKAGNIDPSILPLKRETIKRLNAFAEANNAILDWKNPAQSGESTEAEIEQFEQEGIEIWQQLQQELYPEYEVVYFSEKSRKIITNINEINLGNVFLTLKS
jgi:hypothetical protein